MPFRAIFENGPVEGEQNNRIFAAPDVPTAIYLMPAPEDSAWEWIVVGMEPGLIPDSPWPGQEKYVLDTERSTVQPMEVPGEDQGVAIYVHEEEPDGGP